MSEMKVVRSNGFDAREAAEVNRLLDLLDRMGGTTRKHGFAMLSQFVGILETFAIQNPKYGDSWLHDELGPKSLYAESHAKQMRLKRLLWDAAEGQADVAKIVETIRDKVVYDLLTILKINIQWGPIDEAAVRREIDKT